MNGRALAGPTVGGLTLRLLARHPQRVAFIDETGRQTSYSAAADIIGRYQHVMADHGLRRGATVALLSSNRMEGWCAGVAAQCLGMTVTWLHPLGSVADQRRQLELCEVDALIVDEANHGTRGGELGATFTLGATDYAIDLASAAERVGVAAPRDDADVDDVALITFTGGTTGTPKGVRRRHPQLVAMSQAILSDFELPLSPQISRRRTQQPCRRKYLDSGVGARRHDPPADPIRSGQCPTRDRTRARQHEPARPHDDLRVARPRHDGLRRHRGVGTVVVRGRTDFIATAVRRP